MYSTTPLADPNLDHVGFYILLIGVAFIVSIITGMFIDEDKTRLKGAILSAVGVWALLLAVPFYKSFIVQLPVPQNIQVTATRAGLGEKLSSGRYPTMNAQITYQTPDGLVSFGMGHGQPWPDVVVLYKNP